MKENYIVPEMEIVVLQNTNVITTSNETVLPEDDLGLDWLEV